MKKIKFTLLTACFVSIGVLGAAADEKGGKDAAPAPAQPPGVFFSTNVPSGQAQKASPFSAEISADFVKKVMETSARIEECKKQISERQAYLYENNPKVKALRQQMIDMQLKINKIIEADKDLADMRLSRDMIWTTMPVLPRMREHQPGMGLRLPGNK
ncbi:MAG: hypothetical protein WC299_15985 [Kiritimatiellia bacterium]